MGGWRSSKGWCLLLPETVSTWTREVFSSRGCKEFQGENFSQILLWSFVGKVQRVLTFFWYSSRPSRLSPFLLTMPSRIHVAPSDSSSSTLSALSTDIASHASSFPYSQAVKTWVDPASLPHYHHESPINGNAPDYVKQLNYNTFMSYGVGEEDSFGYKVGKAVRFVEVNVNKKLERQGRLEATTIAEVVVTKRG